ncbi:hypothetical protein [Neobacillus sp. Marseille-QA0830]
MAVAKGVVTHVYPLLPTFNVNLSINTSVIPVIFMLAYQYGINKNRNLYLVGLAASIMTGLILAIISKSSGFLELHKWMKVWFVFLTDYLEFIMAYWLTSFFLWLSNNRNTR